MSAAKLKTLAVNLCRLILATTLIFSGFVKAVDPLGTQYKIHDYLEALKLSLFVPDWITLACSISLSALEFCLGIFLLFAIRRRFITKLTLTFMLLMTLTTVWVYVANPVSDCGCFGDAIKLSNGFTLTKNIILLALAIVLAYHPLCMKRAISKTNQWIVINYTIVFILFSSLFSLYKLPIFDFRPYHVGSNVLKGMEIPEGAAQPEFETTFIMEKDGKQKEFTLENYPDSTWKFIDSKTVQTKTGYIPPIHDFSMQQIDGGEEITQAVLQHPGYTFLLIAPYLEQANDTNFGSIDRIYEYAQEHGYPFYCLTASYKAAIKNWQDRTGAEYPFLNTDAITLKTVIRSNPGLLLLKDGVIIRKWSHNDLPGTEQLYAPLNKNELGRLPHDSVPAKTTMIFLWFILPLFLLTLADRIWAWSKWIRSKEQSNKIYQLIIKRKKNMRKKIVAGNWKMNMNLQEGVALATEINNALVADKPNCDVVICTPFIHLASVANVLNQEVVALGAENCADK
ncbi:MAG TPA: BT_3928 family protein, partial [Prevotella sp.]